MRLDQEPANVPGMIHIYIHTYILGLRHRDQYVGR